MYLNSVSPLAPALDALTDTVARRGQEAAQLEGMAPALRHMGVPIPQQGGGILSMLGLGSSGSSSGANLMSALGIGGSAAPGSRGSEPSQPAHYQPLAGMRGQAEAASDASGSASSSPLAGFQGLIDKANSQYGLPLGYLPRVAAIESEFDPSAVSPTGAKGLFQFTGDTARRYGLADPTSVPDSVDAFGRLTRDNAAALKQSLGRDPTPGELYLAHQQGAAGAAALLKNPSLPAGQVLASIGADPRNIVVNGGSVDMPAGAFASKWTSRFGGAGIGADPRAASSQPAAPSQTAPATTGGLNLPGGMTKEDLGIMIANPASRQMGMKLWEQAATGKDFGFMAGPDGTIIRTDKHTGQAIAAYTPPSKKGFQELNGRLVATDPQTGTASDATPAGMQPNYRPGTDAERTAFNMQPGAPLYFGPDGKPATLNSGNNTTINTGADPLMGAVGKRFDTSLQAAEAARRSIPAIRTARQQLDGGIFAGALAGEKLGLQKLAEGLGLPGVDPSRITNTETFKAAVGPIVLQTVKGLGAGTGISNADRDFAERMAGGNISLDAGSIRRILDIQERAAVATITDHNALVRQLQGTPSGAAAYKNVGPAMRVEMPTAPPPASNTKTIGGQTYTQGPDGHWYVGQ